MREFARAYIALSPMGIIIGVSFDVADWQWFATIPAMIWCLILYPQDTR